MIFDRYWRSVGSVLTGTVVAQFIPIVGSLLLARQYAPTEFGVFSVWLGIVLLFSIVLTGRFETALAIIPDGEPRRLAVLSTLATTALAAFAATVICGISVFVAPSVANHFSPVLVILMIPTALAVAFAQTWQSWAAAEGRYRQLSIMRIAQASSVTVGQIAIGAFIPSATALSLAHAGGVVASLALSIYLMPPGLFPRNQAKVTILTFWRQQYRFPALSLPADSINAAAAQLPVLLVAGRFGADIAGLLAMTMRILGAPIGLLGKSVLDVFKRHAAASYRERGECRAEYVRTFRVLAIASLGFCAVMVVVSEPFFAMAFGENWRGSGTIAVWLLPLFALRFVASPLSYMVYIAGKQHVDLVWQIALLAMTIAALNIPYGHDIALQVYSAGYSFLYVVYLAMSYRFSLGNRR
jgi:O-antigen/teichoic acid export membrane protein